MTKKKQIMIDKQFKIYGKDTNKLHAKFGESPYNLVQYLPIDVSIIRYVARRKIIIQFSTVFADRCQQVTGIVLQ